MSELTTDEARKRLAVSPQHIRGLLRAGKLDGRQLPSGVWLVDADSLERRIAISTGPGRNWSALSSWAILGELSGEPNLVTVSDRTRARVRERIRLNTAEEIARRVADRTTVTRYDADDSFHTVAEMVPTGATALEVLDTDLSPQHSTLEGYVSAALMQEFIREHMLLPDRQGFIEVYEDPGLFLGRDNAPVAVVAADLARSTATRERSAGIRALEEMRQRWLATHTK
ncbi:helix-turn-helix domain-containing protein [Cryobacterium sp. 1639]|uniref:helix-turn-helix domain-containing protein n=1 Tax=Cryobacterium inferilacus TaxID=2866629 RepID=UPI001C731C49|nr:helix-turn-helix domain-containing protein [Cryobacterium sp. 1639]MBX0300731.1 helix-turn-helix domain-containing protein [Cryobacterium sp. 1639]